MRKLIWLALAIGAAELFKKEAVKRGLSPAEFITDLLQKMFNPKEAAEPVPPA